MSLTRLRSFPPSDSSLIENPFVPVEPWDNYGDNFGTKAKANANVVDFGPPSLNPPEPDPAPAPLVSYSTVSGPTQSVGPSVLVKPESSDLPSSKSDKTIDMGEVRLLPRLPAPLCLPNLTHPLPLPLPPSLSRLK